MITLKIENDENCIFGKCCTMHDNEPMPVADNGRVDVEKVKSIIDCELFDIVDMGHGISAWVDDEGMYTHNDEPNWLATALRTAHWSQNSGDILCPCNHPPLFGTVVLLGGADDNGYQLDLTEEQVKYIKSILG